MTEEISATIRLRPTRIGFLVRPSDFSSVRAIMRACSCVWGGIYNPIIPVLRTYPKEWRPPPHESTKASAIALGYTKFFEPDVFVEAEEGLLEEAGLTKLRSEQFERQVVRLDQFLAPEGGKTWAEPAFGLSIQDVLRHVYETEQQFVRRDARESLLVSPLKGSALSEAIFGVYPEEPVVEYLRRDYEAVFKATVEAPSPALWIKALMQGADTPLKVTRTALNSERYWYHDLVIFVFDPTKATDLIDLWNLRLEPYPIAPVPVEWFEPLRDKIFEILKAEHRPIIGNPQGLTHNATIEFGRSIEKERAQELARTLPSGLPQDAVSLKLWRNRVWLDQNGHRNGMRDTRMKVVAEEKRTDLALKDEKRHSTSFQTLVPAFASRFGRGQHRWANTFNYTNYSAIPIAPVLPFNTLDRSWPRVGMGGDQIAVGSEGWIFPQHFLDWSQPVTLLSPDEAVSGSLKRFGIKSELSEPGHIAKQMLEQLGGIRGLHLIADPPTLHLLNKMAGGLRRRNSSSETIEETFDLRSAPVKDWNDLIARRKQGRSSSMLSLSRFADKNVIRLGVESDCPHCKARNWTSLTAIDYVVSCERCLKTYPFPQAGLREQNKNWSYRVAGPFSVPDYGRGSYSALLTLRCLSQFKFSMRPLTYATAMNLSFGATMSEVDLIAWHAEDGHERDYPPTLVICECKSFGTGNLIDASELSKLKLVAEQVEDAVIVISVLRDHFTTNEKKQLHRFVVWGRRPNALGQPTNPVLLLTAHELFMDHHISSTWKALGEPQNKFSDYEHTRTLAAFADSTQQIYLGLPSYSEWRRREWAKRSTARKQRTRLQATKKPTSGK
jgi:hypothetical protein